MEKQKRIQLTGTVSFPASVPAVWRYAINPANLSRCVPGLIKWEEVQPNRVFHLKLAWLSQAKTQMTIPISITWDLVQVEERLTFTALAKPSMHSLIECVGEVRFQSLSQQETEIAFSAELKTPNPFLNQIIKNILPTQIDRFIGCLKANLPQQEDIS